MIESKRIKNPFPGLRPFETEEYRLFFGREGQSEALLARLERTRFLAVVGTSGSGKSSLIRAGLMPALRGGLMAGAGSGWRIAVMRPGGDPIGNLAAELVKPDVLPAAGAGLRADEAEAVIDATLRGGSLGIVDVAYQGRLGEHEKLLIVVDQFEELFRFRAAQQNTNADEAAAFVKLLLEAAHQREQSVYIVLTMRSDFLGDCAQFQGLPEAINDGQYLIPRMTRDERRFAVTGPVGVTRGKITEPLVNRLLNDVGDNPDQLPILQHALMRTWEHWQANRHDGEPIGMQHYEAIGTMSDALSLHADEAFNELRDRRSQEIARSMFKALTERGADNREIRRPTRLDALCAIAGASTEQMTAVIDVFRRAGRSFLMPPAGVPLQPATVIDVSHESLIRNWERLKEWVNEEAQSARYYRRLAETAALHRVGNEGLMQDPALQIIYDWYQEARPNAAWAERYNSEFSYAVSYLDSSVHARDAAVAERERQRNAELERERHERERAEQFAEVQRRAAQRLRSFTFALVLISLLAVVAAGASVFAFAKARRNASLAQSLAEEARANFAAEQVARRESESHRVQAETAKKKAEEEQKHAEAEEQNAKVESKRADAAAKLAAAREGVARRATAEQKAAAEREKKAADAATQARDQAQKAAERLQLDSLSRNGLDSFQRGNFSGALYEFNMTDQMIRQKLDSDPSLAKLQAWVLANIGAANRRLGKFDEARASYEASLAIHEKVSGQKSAEMFDALHGLGHTYLEMGDPAKAEEYYTRAVDYLVSNPTLIDQIYETANLEMIARLYRDVGRYSDAEPYFKRVLAAKKAQGDGLDTLKEMAQFYAVQNNYYEAQKYMEQAIDLEEKQVLHGGETGQLALRELADTYSEVGEIYSILGSEQDSKEAFQLSQALQNAEIAARRTMVLQKSGAASKDEITKRRKENAGHLEQCADLLLKLNRTEAAEKVYLLALGLRILTNDFSAEGNENLAGVLVKLGNYYRQRKNFPEAEKKYQEAVKALSNSRSATSTLYGDALSHLGSLYAQDLKKPAEGERLLNEALNSLLTVPLSENSTTGTLEELGQLYSIQSRFKEAVEASKRKLHFANALMERTSVAATGLDKWNAEDYTYAFIVYVRTVLELANDYKEAGDPRNEATTYALLLNDQLDVSGVVDANILTEYVKVLGEHRAALSSSEGRLDERVKVSDLRRRYIEAVLKAAD